MVAAVVLVVVASLINDTIDDGCRASKLLALLFTNSSEINRSRLIRSTNIAAANRTG